jgi:hypothetical protein
MKKYFFILIILIIYSCSDGIRIREQVDIQYAFNKINSLENIISELTVKDKNYIKIPFSKLRMMFKEDSVSFNKSMMDIGFTKENDYGIIYAKKEILRDTTLIHNIGVGLFMFHDIPMILRIENCLIYTFPIDRLSYYKTAILESGPFTKLYEQESNYMDMYNVNYILEVYVDRFSKLEYQLKYYKNYGSIEISERDY